MHSGAPCWRQNGKGLSYSMLRCYSACHCARSTISNGGQLPAGKAVG